MARISNGKAPIDFGKAPAMDNGKAPNFGFDFGGKAPIDFGKAPDYGFDFGKAPTVDFGGKAPIDFGKAPEMDNGKAPYQDFDQGKAPVLDFTYGKAPKDDMHHSNLNIELGKAPYNDFYFQGNYTIDLDPTGVKAPVDYLVGKGHCSIDDDGPADS